jgi:hypothetical protein
VSTATTASEHTATAEAAAAQQIFQLSTGYMVSTALHAAVSLRIADHLAAGPRSAADLARDTATNEDALYRVLRLLASVGVFREQEGRTFAQSPASSLLQSTAPGSLYDLVLWIADPFHLRIYAEAMHSVKTGQPAVEKAVGMPVFEYFPTDPALSEVFNNAMSSLSDAVIRSALDVYDFGGLDTIVDVAGGHGHVLMAVLEQYPQARGVLADLGHVIAGAEAGIRARGLSSRCRTEVIDFFQAVPSGGDAYIMKHIIHDWDDERAGQILRNIRAAMNPGGRVILLESVLLPANQPDFGKLADIEMLLLPGGRERTEEEFRALFAQAGFELTRIVSTESALSVIEARISSSG